MLGAYPIATRPLAVLAAATGGAIVEANATVTASAIASFDSQAATVIDSDLSSVLALSSAFDSETVTVVESEATAGAALSSSFDGQELTIVESDLSSTLALSSLWDVIPQQISSADMQTALALTSAFDGVFARAAAFSIVVNPPGGPVSTATPANNGTGYVVGNILRINSGDNNATVTVTSVISGQVQAVSVTSAGTGYVNGVYGTTNLSGAGFGCALNIVAGTTYMQWASGATKGSALSSSPALTVTPRGAAFLTVTASATCALAPAFVSGATAGSVATTSDAAVVDWQGIAIGPVLTDFATVLQCVASWSGHRLVSTVRETVRVGRTLTETVNVGRSIEETVSIGE
jgi:hypothetical protein